MSYRILRASEIGEYLYCHRAWWLGNSAGYQGIQVEEMTAGYEYHREHNRAVDKTKNAARLALICIFVAVTVIAFWVVGAL